MAPARSRRENAGRQERNASRWQRDARGRSGCRSWPEALRRPRPKWRGFGTPPKSRVDGRGEGQPWQNRARESEKAPGHGRETGRRGLAGCGPRAALAPASRSPAATGSDGLASAEQSSLVSGPKHTVTVKIRSHFPSLHPNTCTEFPGGCEASASRLGGVQPACTPWEYAAWTPKESTLIRSPKLVFSGPAVLQGTEARCRSGLRLSLVRGRACYRDTAHRSWASKGPRRASFAALPPGNYLLGNGERARRPAKPTAQSRVPRGRRGDTAAHFPLAAYGRHGHHAEDHRSTRKLRKHKNFFLREAPGGGSSGKGRSRGRAASQPCRPPGGQGREGSRPSWLSR